MKAMIRYIISWAITFSGALAVRYAFGFEISVLLLGAVLIQVAWEILAVLKVAEGRDPRGPMGGGR